MRSENKGGRAPHPSNYTNEYGQKGIDRGGRIGGPRGYTCNNQLEQHISGVPVAKVPNELLIHAQAGEEEFQQFLSTLSLRDPKAQQ